MRILVTGGTGFLGTHLVKALMAEGHDVFAFDNGWRSGSVNDNGTDVTSTVDVFRAFEWFRPETVFHLAAINGTHNFYEIPEKVLDVGLLGTRNVISAMKSLIKDSHLVFFSSSEVHQSSAVPTPEEVPLMIPDITNPRFSYAVSKIAGEAMVLNSGLDYTIIRPYNVYGPGALKGHIVPDLYEKIKNAKDHGQVQLGGDIRAMRSFCYVKDFIEGVMLAWQSGFKILNVGSDQMVSVGALAYELASAMNRDDVDILSGKAPLGEVSLRCPDITKLRSLGFIPRSLENGLKEYVKGMA